MSASVQRVLDALRAHGIGATRNGGGWQSRCPSHDDRTPSLSMGEGEDGGALVKCHAGCTLDRVLAPLGLAASDLFEPRTVARLQANRRGISKPGSRPMTITPGLTLSETPATVQPSPGCT